MRSGSCAHARRRRNVWKKKRSDVTKSGLFVPANSRRPKSLQVLLEVIFSHVSVLPPDKASEVINSQDFQTFFDRSSRLIERALNEKYDVAVDYAATDKEEEFVDRGHRSSRAGRG